MYAPFWEEWSRHTCNGLSATDCYILNVLSGKNFVVPAEEAVMFYCRPKNIETITYKLRVNYKEFKEWLILRFQNVLANLYLLGNVETNEQQNPLMALLQNQLMYQHVLTLLTTFRVKSLLDLMDLSFEDATKPLQFKTIYDFMKAYREQFGEQAILLKSWKDNLPCLA